MAVDAIVLAKAILWEQTKGNLRALAVASGQHPGGSKRFPDWELVGERVEKFIKDFEDDALHE